MRDAKPTKTPKTPKTQDVESARYAAFASKLASKTMREAAPILSDLASGAFVAKTEARGGALAARYVGARVRANRASLRSDEAIEKAAGRAGEKAVQKALDCGMSAKAAKAAGEAAKAAYLASAKLTRAERANGLGLVQASAVESGAQTRKPKAAKATKAATKAS